MRAAGQARTQIDHLQQTIAEGTSDALLPSTGERNGVSSGLLAHRTERGGRTECPQTVAERVTRTNHSESSAATATSTRLQILEATSEDA